MDDEVVNSYGGGGGEEDFDDALVDVILDGDAGILGFDDDDNEIELGEEGQMDRVLEAFSVKYDSHLSDIFADFGVNAPFFIDGDALLGQCFENNLVDWKYGGQPLHVIYIFLYYLDGFVQRDTRFRVFFFESNKPLWRNSKLAVRSALIRHLSLYTSVDVDIVPSMFDPAWISLLDRYLPTNILTKMLWAENEDVLSTKLQQVCRTLALQAVLHRRSVLLAEEGIVFRGPRLQMFVVFHRPLARGTQLLAAAEEQVVGTIGNAADSWEGKSFSLEEKQKEAESAASKAVELLQKGGVSTGLAKRLGVAWAALHVLSSGEYRGEHFDLLAKVSEVFFFRTLSSMSPAMRFLISAIYVPADLYSTLVAATLQASPPKSFRTAGSRTSFLFFSRPCCQAVSSIVDDDSFEGIRESV